MTESYDFQTMTVGRQENSTEKLDFFLEIFKMGQNSVEKNSEDLMDLNEMIRFLQSVSCCVWFQRFWHKVQFKTKKKQGIYLNIQMIIAISLNLI